MKTEEFIDFLKERSDPMKKFSNDINNKPLQSDREKVDEIYNAVMNANEILDRKISFSYYGTCNTLDIYRTATDIMHPHESAMCHYDSDNMGLQHAALLRTIQTWQSEKLEENIEEIYNEEQNKNADTAISTL